MCYNKVFVQEVELSPYPILINLRAAGLLGLAISQLHD